MKQFFNREFLLSNKQIVLKAAAIIGIIVVAFFVFVFNKGEDKEPSIPIVEEQETAASSQSEQETSGIILVDVGGAVERPQVVELKEGSRVADAVSAAGGLKANADAAEINQAAFLSDGEKVYIPTKGEMRQDATGFLSEIQPASGQQKINLNTASSEELQTLNGVGPATAEKILEYRSTNGFFKSIEELKEVNGIGEKIFEKLKEHIMV